MASAVIEDGRRGTDVIELLPASMKIADMHADIRDHGCCTATWPIT